MHTMPESLTVPRRWAAYSLRTLITLVTVVAIGSAWLANERRQSQREMEIADALTNQGAHVMLGGPFDDFDRSPDDQVWWRRTIGQIAGPRAIHALVVSLNPQINSSMAELKSLRTLNVFEPVDDTSWLSHLKSLER